jgi:hypothetical protein
MPKMTKEGEARLKAALDDVVDLVNGGDTPDDAIVKVASDHAIPPGQIGLMVAAYNTGRTTRQREGHSSLLDKAADFPIADAPSILERLYPTHVKSAAAIEHESGVHYSYTMAPTWYARSVQETGMEKAAEAVDWKLTDKTVTPYPTTVRDLEAGQRLIWAREKAARADEEERLEASRIQNQIIGDFAKLAEYFAMPDNLTLLDVHENVETLFGKEGMAVLRQLHRTRPNLVKRAYTGRFHSAMGEPYHTVAHLVDLAGRLRQMLVDNEKQAADRATALEEMERPFVVARRPSLLDPISSPGTKEAATGPVFLPSVSAMLAREFASPIVENLRPQEKEKAIGKQLARIATPQHEQALRDIASRADIEDMLSNDPIIKGHNREDVLGAFNQISQLAPRASQQPLLMNALLRTRLQQGSLDPFQVGDLVKTERMLRDVGTIPTPPPGPGVTGGSSPTSVLAV